MKKHILVCLLWLSLAYSYAQTMHLIIVVDTYEEGRSVDRTKDFNEMVQFWRETAENTGVPFKMTHIGTQKFNTTDVLNTCRNTQISTNDILIFYYSGHGANDRSSKWPIFDLKDNTLRMTEIIKILRTKNPKFLMVMGDCCNGYLNNARSMPFESNPEDSRLYRDLFLNFKGRKQVIVSASSPGEYSWSDRAKGAFWGIAFREAFRRATDNSNTSASWEQLLELGKKLAAQVTDNKQTAQFDVITQGDAADD